MAYILSAERHEDPSGSFQRYRAFVNAERHRFPASVLALVESDWYFDFTDHRAPHDSWLREVRITEIPGENEDHPPEIQMRVRLLGAYHDGDIEFIYSGVISYDIRMMDLTQGHCDWRYDEFRLSESGDVIHEIEWCGAIDTGRWLIQARNVEHRWYPSAGQGP
ncbi:MAG: hypothetical protein EOP88_17520 [Verrucomicrobiaceae bacterium]|nr:MAG: hypothetical protein EOP88_17520 [Verrucomicrobiaceae bacterium]